MGWVDVPLVGTGQNGGRGLRAFLVQVRVLENHQNGKDTHVRGVQVFARDERVPRPRGKEDSEEESEGSEEDGMQDLESPGRRAGGKGKSLFDLRGLGGLDEPDWMKDPVLR